MPHAGAAESPSRGAGFVRRLTFPHEHTIGQIDLGAALRADRRMLALLSLDPRIASCPVPGALFIDAETTGLGGSGTVVFLLGLCW